jgi:hypothetical protein
MVIQLIKPIFIAVLLACTTLTFAQNNKDTSDTGYAAHKVKIHKKSAPQFPSYKAIGFNMSPTSGLGFSYRQIDQRIGLELTALPVFIQGELGFLSVGFTGVYKLNRVLYTGVSASYWQLGAGNKGTVNSSINFGIEGTFENIGAKLGTGYGVYNISSKFSTLPTIDFGIYILINK